MKENPSCSPVEQRRSFLLLHPVSSLFILFFFNTGIHVFSCIIDSPYLLLQPLRLQEKPGRFAGLIVQHEGHFMQVRSNR